MLRKPGKKVPSTLHSGIVVKEKISRPRLASFLFFDMVRARIALTLALIVLGASAMNEGDLIETIKIVLADLYVHMSVDFTPPSFVWLDHSLQQHSLRCQHAALDNNPVDPQV